MRKSSMLLLLLLVACAEPQRSVITAPPTDVILQTGSDFPNASFDARRGIKIDAYSGNYLPNEIEVNQNEIVRLIFTSRDFDYDMRLPGYGIRENLTRGDDVLIEFNASRDGEFLFFTADNPRMRGLLKVRSAAP